jgi:hypothetical protein
MGFRDHMLEQHATSMRLWELHVSLAQIPDIVARHAAGRPRYLVDKHSEFVKKNLKKRSEFFATI